VGRPLVFSENSQNFVPMRNIIGIGNFINEMFKEASTPTSIKVRRVSNLSGIIKNDV